MILRIFYSHKVFPSWRRHSDGRAECGEVFRTRSRNYFGPTKIGLALIFIIK